MLRVVAGKVGGATLTILGASFIAFLFLRLLPGDPARLVVGLHATEEVVQRQRESMGLTEPLHVQYVQYLYDFIKGDWGFAYGAGQPVRTQILGRLPATLELALYAFLLVLVGAIVLAVLSTYRHRPVVDRSVRGIAFLGYGTPPYWFGLLAILFFSSYLGILPGPEGRLGRGLQPPPSVTGLYTIDALVAGDFRTFLETVRHLILPALSLALAPFAFLVRLLRVNLLEVSREQFVLAARSKGLTRWSAFWKHALPNAFLPTLTASGLLLGYLLTSSVLVERVFEWPGVGSLIVQSILRHDFAVVQAFVLLSACLYVGVNMLIDITYGVLDPRVRVAERDS